MTRWFLSAILGSLLLSACGGSLFHQGDGPGVPIDTSSIPDVVPRNEPKSKYGNPESYVVRGRRYHVLDSARGYAKNGIASWYGKKFHGRRTSSGEPFNMYAMTAAHKTLPLPTYVLVTNRDNGRKIVVKVNDRGPFVDDRLIDLSYASAAKLGILGNGTGRVEVRVLEGGQPVPRSSPGSDTVAASGELYVQLGAFQYRANAELLRAQVAGADIRDAIVVVGKSAKGAPLYRVRVGPLDDGDVVKAIIAKLDRAGIKPYRIVNE